MDMHQQIPDKQAMSPVMVTSLIGALTCKFSQVLQRDKSASRDKLIGMSGIVLRTHCYIKNFRQHIRD